MNEHPIDYEIDHDALDRIAEEMRQQLEAGVVHYLDMGAWLQEELDRRA